MGSLDRHMEQLSGQYIGGSDTAADDSGSGSQRSRIRTLRAAQTEFHDSVALCGVDNTGRTGGNQGLVIDQIQESRFDQLGFHQRSDYLDQRFPRKDNRSFGNGIDIACKMEAAEIFQKIILKEMEAAQIINIIRIKMQIPDIVYHLLQSGTDRIAAVAGIDPVKSVENHDLIGGVFVVALHHGKLVEVSHQSNIRV